MDLFATRIIINYYSYYPDPEAIGINAFAHKWSGFVYIFAPFNLITRILKKIQEDKTSKVLMIVPKWTVSPWYPVLKAMSMVEPTELKNHKKLLLQPSKKEMVHPLYPKMKLLACLLSGESI